MIWRNDTLHRSTQKWGAGGSNLIYSWALSLNSQLLESVLGTLSHTHTKTRQEGLTFLLATAFDAFRVSILKVLTI